MVPSLAIRLNVAQGTLAVVGPQNQPLIVTYCGQPLAVRVDRHGPDRYVVAVDLNLPRLVGGARGSRHELAVRDADVGPAAFQVDVFYSEAMDTSVAPTITFAGSGGGSVFIGSGSQAAGIAVGSRFGATSSAALSIITTPPASVAEYASSRRPSSGSSVRSEHLRVACRIAGTGDRDVDAASLSFASGVWFGGGTIKVATAAGQDQVAGLSSRPPRT